VADTLSTEIPYSAENAFGTEVALVMALFRDISVSNYRVIIRGVQAGQSVDAVASALARFSKKTPEKIHSLLSSGRDLVAKRTPDMQPALRYKQLLEKMGCACHIQAEITPTDDDPGNSITSLTGLTAQPSASAASPRDFTYNNTPIGMRIREISKLLRLKELVGATVLGFLGYYAWANHVFDSLLGS
jgi:hypothetical protein